MKNPYLSSSFFAFLGMVLVAVTIALLMNMPPEPSHAASPAAVESSDNDAAVDSTAKVVDARVEYDAPNATTGS